MEPEICIKPGSDPASNPATKPGKMPGGEPGQDATPAPRRTAARVIDGRPEDRHLWAIAALLFPLAFCAVVGLGVFLMFHRSMGYFKPAPSGKAAPLAAPLARAADCGPAAGRNRTRGVAQRPASRA